MSPNVNKKIKGLTCEQAEQTSLLENGPRNEGYGDFLWNLKKL